MAFAQIAFPQSKPANRIVSILSDGNSEPNSLATRILSDISVMLDKDGDLRVLTVSGYGGPLNVRDLLQLRGADLAVMNNDVLAYLDLAKALPEARTKIKLIAPLFHQGVYLFARENIKSVDGLRGRKIGVPAFRPSRGVTAKTIFGTLKVPAEVVELDDKELAKRSGVDLDAVLVFERDLPDLRTLNVTPRTHHLLAIPTAGPLAQVYLPRKGENAPIGGFTGDPSFETIQVTTLLAAFDWKAKQGRYLDVVTFVGKFFTLLPKVREKNPASPFSRTDVKVTLPGWQRFGPAEAAAAMAPAPPPLAKIEAKTDQPQPIASDSSHPGSEGETLKIAVVNRPPLTNSRQDDGGVAVKLVVDALDAAGTPVSIQWVDSEKSLLESVLSSKTADAGLFWETPSCDAPRNQSASEANLCDRAVLSQPLMRAVVAVFSRLDAPFDPNSTDPAQIRTVCAPENQPMAGETLASLSWTQSTGVKVLRPKGLIDCLAAVDRRDADAMISIEAEGRYVIEKLKLTNSLQISQRAEAPTGIHAVVAKDNPKQAQLIQKIDDALAQFRSSSRYAGIMASHLADLTGSAERKP
jgi:hypothetical protein